MTGRNGQLELYICGRDEMLRHVAALRPSHLVSLTAPEELPSTPREVPPERHLRLGFHDISEPMPGCIMPEAAHIERLLEFTRAWRPGATVLVHCMAGVSRSTAAALIAAAVHVPGRERACARELRIASPHASPNRRMIELGDELLGLGGALVAACSAMGPPELYTGSRLAELRLAP